MAKTMLIDADTVRDLPSSSTDGGGEGEGDGGGGWFMVAIVYHRGQS